MPRTKKTTDVKATDKKTVKAAPAEEVKFAELVIEPDKNTENKSEAKKEAAVAPAKAETEKAAPKKAGRKPSAKKAAAPAKAETKTVAAPAKKETKKAAAPAKKPDEKTKKAPAAKKTAPAKAAKAVTTSVLQVAGSEFDFDKVVKAVEGLKKKNAGKSLEIYIKPEDRAIYYVVNGKGGKKIDL